MEHFKRKQQQYDASEIFTDFKPRKPGAFPKSKPRPPLCPSDKSITLKYPSNTSQPLVYPREKVRTLSYMSDMGRTLPYLCDSATPVIHHSETTRTLPNPSDKYNDSCVDHFLPPIHIDGRHVFNEISSFSTMPSSSAAMRQAEHNSLKRVMQSTYCYSPLKPDKRDLTNRAMTEGNRTSVPKDLLSCRNMDKLKSGNVHFRNILPPIGETYQVRTDYYRGVLCKSDSDSSASMVSSDSIDLDLNANSEWVGDFFESMRKYFISCDDMLLHFLSEHGDKRRDAVCEELDRYDEKTGLAELVRNHVINEILSHYF